MGAGTGERRKRIDILIMAKTAEEKAAAKADKEAAKEAKQEAKAEAKAEKAAEKAEARAEKDQVVNLKSAQKAELMAYEQALSDQGLSKKEIKELLKDEKLANKDEVLSAKETLSADGLQWIGLTQTRPDGTTAKGPILSQMSTIGEEYRPAIAEDLKGALSYYGDYNLSTLSKRGNAEIGFGLDDILKVEYSRDPETGEITKNTTLGKTLDRAEEYVKNTFTAEELEEQGVKIKQDKNNPDLYTWKFGSDERKGYVFFKDNGDGTFTGVGANRLAIDMPSGGPLSGVFKAIPFLPELAAIGTAMIPGGQAYAGQVYAAGKGLQTASQGGDFGDILKSAGMAYLGSNIVPGMVQGYLPADLTSIPGFTQGVTRATMGALSGQDLDEALMSGLISGAGGYTGAQIAGLTGSPDIGKVGGALATAALSGGDVEQALQNAIVSNAVQSGLQAVAPETTGLITDPTVRRIAENSLSRIVNQGMADGPRRPMTPTPIPGIVRRQFDNVVTGSSKPLVQPLRAAKGGSIRAPLRRNVSELIPLRRGGLSALRGA